MLEEALGVGAAAANPLGSIGSLSGGLSADSGPAYSGSSNSQGPISVGGIGDRNETDTTGIGVAMVVVVVIIVGAFLYANRNKR